MFIYMSIASVFTLLLKHRSFLMPYWAALLFFFDFEEKSVNHFSVHSIPSVVVYMTKGDLLMWMHYVALHSSFVLNDYQTYFFYYFSNRSKLHPQPDHHCCRRLIPLRNVWLLSDILRFTLVEWYDFTEDRLPIRDWTGINLFQIYVHTNEC